MQRSDFILMIKKETDRMIEAWNSCGSRLETSELYDHMSIIELLICIFMCVFSKDPIIMSFDFNSKYMSNENPLCDLQELTELTIFLVECRQLFYDDKIRLSIDAKKELSQSILAVDSEIRNLPVPVKLR